MDQQRGFVLGEVVEARFIHGLFLALDSPGNTLGFLVERADDRRGLIRNRVVVVAAKHAIFIERDLEDVVRRRLVALDHGEDTERLPLFVRGGLGVLARSRDLGRLLGVFFL